MSVEERAAFWQAQADLRLGKKHLEILLSAWRAAELEKLSKARWS